MEIAHIPEPWSVRPALLEASSSMPAGIARQ